MAVPEARGRPRLPYALGALLGLLVVLAMTVWAYLVLSGADYSGIIDLAEVIRP